MAAESRLQPGPETPLVVVTILNHRGVTDAQECTRSVLDSDYPNFCVIIVDNGSTDGSGDQLRDLACDPRVTMVRSEENRGCVGGTNLAIASALQTGAPYVLTLSNDIVVRRDVISRLVRIMRTKPETGVIQPCILVHDEPERIWSRGGTFSHWLARGFMPEVDRTYRAGDERVIDVDVLVGCAMFFRRELLMDVGTPDERYFFQNEEYDFFCRIRRSGWRVKVAMGACITHKHGRTIGPESYDRWYYATRNRLLFIREQLNPLQRSTALTFFALSRIPKFCQWQLQGRSDLIQATFHGWRDYAARRFGPLAPAPDASLDIRKQPT